MLDATPNHWPEATSLVYRYYGDSAPVLYTWVGHEDRLHVSVILSEKGARMGCKLGSALFDFGIHPVYDALCSLHPSFTLRCLTDDAPVFAMPDDDKWPDFFAEYAAFLQEFQDLGRPRGIRFNKAKSFLLLPPSAPDPAPGVLPDWVQVVRDGLVIAGAAIGTDDFVIQHFTQAVEDYGLSLAKLDDLSHVKPVCGMVLLGRCFTKVLSYLVRVTPTVLVSGLIERADALTAAARYAALTPEGVSGPDCTDGRLHRADAVAALPLRSGGFGHTPLALSAPGAFYSSLALAREEGAFCALAGALDDYLLDAHTRLIQAVGGPSGVIAGSNLAVILPIDASRVCERGFFLDIFSKHPKLKVEATLSRAVSKHSRKALMAEVHPDQAGSGDLTRADSVHLSLLTGRSQLSRFLSASLWLKSNRSCAANARATMRYILGLPQLLRLGNHRASSSSMCEVDVCQAHHGEAPELGPTGDHICSRCPCGGVPRAALHRLIQHATHRSASLCASSRMEPPTSEVLLGDYTDDACRLLFPKNPSAKSNKLAKRAIEVDAELRALPANDPNRQTLTEELDNLKAMLDADTSSRRLDLEIIAADGDVAWVDVAGLHPTAASYLGPNESFVRKLADAEAGAGAGASSLQGQSSTAVQTRARQKKDKYQPLVVVADQQVKGGRRTKAPTFFSCIISHLGELSSDFFKLIGWLTGKLKASFAAGIPRRNGLTAAAAGARFAAEMKGALMCAVVSGFGQMLVSGGFLRHRVCVP